jgi:hypothetical protein
MASSPSPVLMCVCVCVCVPLPSYLGMTLCERVCVSVCVRDVCVRVSECVSVYVMCVSRKY